MYTCRVADGIACSGYSGLALPLQRFSVAGSGTWSTEARVEHSPVEFISCFFTLLLPSAISPSIRFAVALMGTDGQDRMCKVGARKHAVANSIRIHEILCANHACLVLDATGRCSKMWSPFGNHAVRMVMFAALLTAYAHFLAGPLAASYMAHCFHGYSG